MSRPMVLLLFTWLVGCSGATHGIRSTTHARGEAHPLGRTEFHLKSHSAPLASPQRVLGGSELLRLVPRGASIVAEPTGAVATGEALVAGGAVAAASGSVILVCLTVDAAREGTKTPIDIADTFYGTRFGDIQGWIQSCFSPQAADTRAGAAPAVQSSPEAREQNKNLGRIYVTYTKFNVKTSRYYSGRTSMIVDLLKPLRSQAQQAVDIRDSNHHVDEEAEPRVPVFRQALLDVFDVGTAVDYASRYTDVAYWRIRGREQQLIDFQGGARSDTREPYRTENIHRGVAKDNPLGKLFHDAATQKWGQLYPYTGD